MNLKSASSGALIALCLFGCAIGSSYEADELRAEPTSQSLDPDVMSETSVIDAGAHEPTEARGGPALSPRDAGITAANSDASDGATKDARAVAPDARVQDAAPADVGATSPCAFAYAGTLAEFDLTTLAGTPTNVSPVSTAPGLVVTPLERVGVSAASANGGINASAWPTAGEAAGKYFSFAVTAPPGCRMTFADLGIDLLASSTGPKKASVATSVDDFASRVAVPMSGAGGAQTVSVNGVVSVRGTVEIRVYGSSAAAAGGTMRIENVLTLAGSLN